MEGGKSSDSGNIDRSNDAERMDVVGSMLDDAGSMDVGSIDAGKNDTESIDVVGSNDDGSNDTGSINVVVSINAGRTDVVGSSDGRSDEAESIHDVIQPADASSSKPIFVNDYGLHEFTEDMFKNELNMDNILGASSKSNKELYLGIHGDFMLVLNSEGIIKFILGDVKTRLNFTNAELLEKNIVSFIHPTSLNKFQNYLTQRVKLDPSKEVECVVEFTLKNPTIPVLPGPMNRNMFVCERCTRGRIQ